MNEAVNTLEKNLSCENPAVEVRAAQIIIELGTEGIKTAELIERVDALDKLMKGNKNGWTSKGA
jgi:hypothetical protein